MSEINFYKYQGAGNDFILIDAYDKKIELSQPVIYQLCSRRFGIGADGLMLLKKHDYYDFEMIYYNADGLQGTMCGNGGRCIVSFAKKLGLIKDFTRFIAIDGEHEAYIYDNDIVKLKMQDVKDIEIYHNYYFLNTGSPHYVEFVDDIQNIDVVQLGKKIRYSKDFEPEGTNVNFAQIMQDILKIRTYERGVEDETLACGTGSVALALAYTKRSESYISPIKIHALGGELRVYFKYLDNYFSDIWLEGPAKFVFQGEVTI